MSIAQKRDWVRQMRGLLPVLLTVYVPSLVIVIVANRGGGIPLSDLTSDPATVTGAPFYVGFLSNIGILFWCSSVVVCLFSFAATRREEEYAEKDWPSFILASGLVSSVLLFDDLFLFHEKIAPFYLGVPQKIVVFGYMAVIVWYLWRFKNYILKTEFVPLLLAFGFFAASLAFDMKLIEVRGQMLFEDGSKLLGILCWFTYFAKVCLSRHVES